MQLFLHCRVFCEVRLGCEVIATPLLVVAPPYIIGKLYFTLCVNIASEASGASAGRADVPCPHTFVWF